MNHVPWDKLPEPWLVRDERRTVLVLRNPKAGPRDRTSIVSQAARAMAEAGYRVEQYEDRQEFANRVADPDLVRQLRCVVPAGGDGTSTLAATLLPPSVPLAPLCIGNENVMARWIGYRGSISQLLRAIDTGRAVTLDAGQANGRLFLFTLTCGFDAQVVWLMHQRRRGHAGHAAYVAPLLRTIWCYQYPSIQLQLDVTDSTANVQESAWKAPWVFVFNMPCYAMGIPVCREARPTDGLLDVCTFPPRHFWSSLVYLVLILLGRHDRCRGARHERVAHIRLEAEKPIPYQMDGDPGDRMPVSIRVCPKRWSILLP